MDLIACSYTNIWPFTDRPVTVNFLPGKFLIKAPIGSWKSFLFFDGPVFALYKYAARPMLHRHAKQWRVRLLFEEEGSYYFIERQLKPTKAGGESIQSRLYRYTPSSEHIDPMGDAWYHDIITHGVDIYNIIEKQLEEVPYTNQRELDSSLESLLPPLEVALSIHFLMQDAENVFELQPAKRIEVFKHLFWLLGIDEAKEVINTRRKELQTTIKVKSDTQQESAKLRSLLHTIHKTLQTIEHIDWLPTQLHHYLGSISQQPFFRDLSLIQEQVNIDQFSVDDVDLKIFATLQQEISNYFSQAAWLQGRMEQIEQTVQAQNKQLYKLTQERDELNMRIQNIQQRLSSIDVISIQQLKERRKELLVQQDSCNQYIDTQVFADAGYQNVTIIQADGIVAQLIAEGKTLAAEEKNILLQQEQMVREQQRAQQRKNELEDQLQKLETSYSTENVFYCDKIEGNCPYVELIKWVGLAPYHQQKEFLKQQLSDVAQILVRESHDDGGISVEYDRILQRKEEIKLFLERINWKAIQQYAVQFQQFQQQVRELDKNLEKVEWELAQQTVLQEESTKLHALIESKEQQIMALQDEVIQTQRELEKFRDQLQMIPVQWLTQLEQYLKTLMQSIDQIQQVVSTYKENKLLIKQLQEEEQMAKELYAIFSKELMVVVLEDFLPVLQERINLYLAQMVDYEIRFAQIDGTDDKIELRITVHDHHGEREVKSLSGGQKAIIKIAWILAVSVYKRSKFLLLDETITSMDVFTVAHVADTLEDFIKSHQMKFYVVTHSPQIQEMAIWDKTVEVLPSAT